MRKNVVGSGGQAPVPPLVAWWDLGRVARVEVSSEDADRPVESALLPDQGGGWRAGGPGPQTVRVLFDTPQRVRRVRLRFVEPAAQRTQEFVLRWGPGDGQPVREVVRQQWTFGPGGSIEETEDYRVDLPAATVLELAIIPDISGGDARASLAELRIA